MAEIGLSDRDYADAVTRGEQERRSAPAASAVRYDSASDRIVVEFDNGAAFLIPSRLLEGLADAQPGDIEKVELLGETGLHWSSLDIDLSIEGLMHGVFGTASYISTGRKGGMAKSTAKAKASRQNGALGGRPRKTS